MSATPDNTFTGPQYTHRPGPGDDTQNRRSMYAPPDSPPQSPSTPQGVVNSQQSSPVYNNSNSGSGSGSGGNSTAAPTAVSTPAPPAPPALHTSGFRGVQALAESPGSSADSSRRESAARLSEGLAAFTNSASPSRRMTPATSFHGNLTSSGGGGAGNSPTEGAMMMTRVPGASPILSRRLGGGGGGVGGGGVDDDDVKSDHGGSSNFGGSQHGTNSTGSGEEGEEDPLLNIVIDIVRKARRAQAKAEEAARAFAAKRAAAIAAGTTTTTATTSGGVSPSDGTPASPLSPLRGELAGADSSVGFGFSSGELGGGSPASAAAASGADSERSSQSGGAYAYVEINKSLMAYCKQQQLQLYSELDAKSARGLILGDPHASIIVFANEAAQRLFGRLDLVGSKLESLMTSEIAERHAGIIASYQDRYHQEYKKTGGATESRLLDVIKPRRMQVVRKFNGRDQIFHIDAWVRSLRLKDESPTKPCRLMALECFEAQQYHEDNESSRIFRAALKNVSDGIVVADFDGTIEYINTSMELLCGYPLGALQATRASVNVFLPAEISHQQHEGYLAHFRQTRKSRNAAGTADAQERVVGPRKVTMKTAFGHEEIQLRVEVAYNKLIAYIKSTREFIPREEFETERLKLLLPAAVVKMLRGAESRDITSHFWEFDKATVLFTDVVGFSSWAKSRPVKAVHDRMQPMFSEFEQIIQAFGGELIHRIGDAVMAIFGFNGEERHHARYALSCAVELQQWALSNGFLIRIGLTSGSIGAGIYGSAKGRPGFDAWGPVVNIAKRLEAYGEPGQVHISQSVVTALGHKFSGALHSLIRPKRLDDVKGVEDNTETYIVPVKDDQTSQIVLPEKFIQMVNFQKARYARWKIQNEETERRLAELQKAAR